MQIWPWSKPVTSILIVCTANVCRSPAAEVFLTAHLKALGVGRRVEVRSAGTSVASPGMPPDPRVVAYAASKGLKFRRKGASRVSDSLMANADFVWVMEDVHRGSILENYPGYADVVSLFDPSGEAVPDPYFRSQADVESTMERLEELAFDRATFIASETAR
ncbi:MAG: low molecular weight phosphotyrosine protein phosphatase [Congregibacter sp.]